MKVGAGSSAWVTSDGDSLQKPGGGTRSTGRGLSPGRKRTHTQGRTAGTWQRGLFAEVRAEGRNRTTKVQGPQQRNPSLARSRKGQEGTEERSRAALRMLRR